MAHLLNGLSLIFVAALIGELAGLSEKANFKPGRCPRKRKNKSNLLDNFDSRFPECLQGFDSCQLDDQCPGKQQCCGCPKACTGPRLRRRKGHKSKRPEEKDELPDFLKLSPFSKGPVKECMRDDQCSIERCCNGMCGGRMNLVGGDVRVFPPQNFKCPAVPSKTPRKCQERKQDQCYSDCDCEREEMCCFDRCSTRKCIQRFQHAHKPLKDTKFIPVDREVDRFELSERYHDFKTPTKRCSSDKKCGFERCCNKWCGGRMPLLGGDVRVYPRQSDQCPPPQPPFWNSKHCQDLNVRDQCLTDCDCERGELCCEHFCGAKKCLKRVVTKVTPNKLNKLCSIQVSDPLPDFCAFTSIVRSPCSSDTDCTKDKICCPDECGNQSCQH